ncbi:MAG: hypothetical protein R3B13_02495 [Polyangiaceae bacterium]
MSVLLFAVQLALGILVPWWILRRDMARLEPKELERAWPKVSFWMAIVVFGPLALPFHFTKTRRSLWGFFLGLLWTVAAFVAIGVTSTVLGSLLSVE